MKDIIIGGASAPSRPAIGRTIAINRFSDIAAGTYWRAKDDVPELTKPQKRERSVYLPDDHPDRIEPRGNWGDSERNRIGTENYMVDVPIRSGVPADRMHLLLSLKLADGNIHAVVLKEHPNEKEGERRTYLIDEFLHFFELVDEDEAKAIRDAEVAAIQQEIADLQKALIAGPPLEEPAGLLGHQASLPAPAADPLLSGKLPPKPTVGAMIANIGRIETLQAAAGRAVAIAERQSKWISEHSAEIAGRTKAMVPFFQERAAAALATTEAVMRYATDLQKGVESLGLYTGDGVEVRELATGEGAPAGEPLVIYRDQLFLDEEYLAHLGIEGQGGGADHQDFGDFVEALTADEGLKARVFPYPRMVVLMRYRRTAKSYFDGTTMEAALANAEYNKPNMIQFLLIRNGEKLWQVNAELLQEIRALYPTKGMGDAAFKGVDGTMLKPEDLTFAAGKERFTDLARVYKNVAILLWGLHDRAAIDFGPFYDPVDWTPSGFLDPLFQERHMRFWDPYGDTTMIGTGRPRFRDWVKEVNGWLRSGSRVMVTRASLRGKDAYNGSEIEEKQSQAVRTVGTGEDAAHEFIVRKTKKGHVVGVDAARMVYPRERYRRSYELRQNFDIALDETDHGYTRHGGLGWLCLDIIEPGDIDHFLESRLDRTSYFEHQHLLRAVRLQLLDEAGELEPLLAKLERALADGGIEVPDGSTPRLMARHAVRLWRTANRGAMPPADGDAGHAAAYKAMLNGMNALAGNDHPVEAAEALAAAEGRAPLRLAMTGRDRWALYATSAGDEVESTLFEHVWVTRLSCQRKGGGLAVTSRTVVPMPDAVADEEILHEWDALADWRSRCVPATLNEERYHDKGRRNYDYATIRKGLAKARSGTLEPFRTPIDDLSAHLVHLNATRRHKTKGRSVARLTHVEPFAIIRTAGFNRKLIEGFTSRYETVPHDNDYMVLRLEDCPYRMAWRLATTDEERNTIAKAYASQYNVQETNRQYFLKDSGNPSRITAMRLADWAAQPEDPIMRDGLWNGIELDANWSENVRTFDTKKIRWDHENGRIWSPTLQEMAVWINPTAPAILNDLCARFSWEAVPFDPKPR